MLCPPGARFYIDNSCNIKCISYILLKLISLEFETPVSTTVPQDTTAVFTCRATGVAWLDWFVDGRVASNRVIKERGFRYETTSSHGVIHSVLNALATQANNGTSVHCEVSGGQVSPPAILTVQGKNTTAVHCTCHACSYSLPI